VDIEKLAQAFGDEFVVWMYRETFINDIFDPSDIQAGWTSGQIGTLRQSLPDKKYVRFVINLPEQIPRSASKSFDEFWNNG
jgi:hypothetical protein